MSLDIEFVAEARPATAVLRLGGRATFEQAPQLREALFESIEAADGKNLVVELDAVTRIDTSAMAVLVEGLMATQASETTIFLLNPSRSVREVFRLAGLEEALTCCFDSWEDFTSAVAG
ncbi:MAG: STAS domain-containing protein [Thermoanaerobaculia bacterium]|nr:STAS domain-containing protein [Thermoanaerobaculia bacterium]